MNALNTLGLSFIRGELYLAIASLFLLLYGVYKPSKSGVNLVLTTVLILALSGFLVFDGGVVNTSIFNGMFVSNEFTLAAKMLIICAAILALMLATDWLEERNFEYAVLVLIATLGMMLMVSSGSLLALYMSVELMSLPLYVLASFDRDNAKSTEAGLKYFVLGSLASGMILFGISLVYGFSGTIRFDALASLLATGGTGSDSEVSRALIIGVVFVFVGFCFKLSAAPFHMWTPDVYEGAPTPVTAFFSTVPKIAVMALLVRLFFEPFYALKFQWQQLLIAASILSMLVGALAAIMQTNIKRLLAYSSIGHVGFMLLGLASISADGVKAVMIYLTLYVFMSSGLFACVLIAGKEELKDYSGLAKTRPVLAFAIAALLFSMAGIPPLSGFFAKMFVLLAAVNAGMLWLAVIGVVASVIGCYYYLKLIKIMYFDDEIAADVIRKSSSSPLVIAVAVIGLAVTLGFALFPDWLVNQSIIAAKVIIL